MELIETSTQIDNLNFVAVDCWLNNQLILRHYIEFNNFPDFENRWFLIEAQYELGCEESAVSETVAERLMEIVSQIEEICGEYSNSLKTVIINNSQAFERIVEIDDISDIAEFLAGEHNIDWYIFRVIERVYLVSNRSDGCESIYELDKNRKWKPIHNAPKFDGYESADMLSLSVSFSNSGKKVLIKKI